MTITITFIIPGERVEAVMRDKSGRQLQRVTGTFTWHPQTIAHFTAEGSANTYPQFLIVDCQGVAEILEQRVFGGPLYVTDDPDLRLGILH